jgi:2-keto-3-deoxy-L-rhamnonate aldolase RhmA
MENMVRACEARGKQAIIRSSNDDKQHLLRILEAGSNALMVPHISSANDAKKVVESVKYPPEGSRGLSPYTRQHNFSDQNLSDSLSHANENQFLGLLVEGEEGIKNIAEISKVQGIDLIYIGLFDLAKTIGMVDNLTDPKILKLLKDTKEIIQANGVMVGSMAKDVEYAKILSDIGYDFIAFYNDSAALKSYFQDAIKDIKAN